MSYLSITDATFLTLKSVKVGVPLGDLLMYNVCLWSSVLLSFPRDDRIENF
jgi:hypothetical protein